MNARLFLFPSETRATTLRRQDLFRLYDSSVGQRDAWGNQASKVDARVEDEWDSIYVDCQDGPDADFQDFSFDGSGDLLNGFGGGSSSSSGGAEGLAMGRDNGGAPTAAAAAASSSGIKGERRRASSSRGASVSTGGSRSALMAAMDAYQAEEEEEEEEGGEESGEDGEEAGETKGFDEEDIIDCAIRGRWTFKNNDDPVRTTPTRARAAPVDVVHSSFPGSGLVSLWPIVLASSLTVCSFFVVAVRAFSLRGCRAATCFPPSLR